ncbi:CD209 antigen-like protein C isoform X2 [Paramormyrops kingsleyae]
MGVKPKQDNDDCSILAKEKEQLLLKLNNMTQLQEQNNQLQNSYTKLEETKNKLVMDKNYFQQQCVSLQKDKDEIQNNYDALLSKLPLLQKYCHTTEKGRVCDPCPQGWEKHNSKCYYFSTSVTTWNESQNNCSKEAAHLVTVNSEEEQGFITKEGSSSYWIGLTDSAEEGVWRWVDGTGLKQGFWLYGEPDNKDQQSAGIKANCVINSNEWKDEPCEDQYRWICETQTLLRKPLHI